MEVFLRLILSTLLIVNALGLPPAEFEVSEREPLTFEQSTILPNPEDKLKIPEEPGKELNLSPVSGSSGVYVTDRGEFVRLIRARAISHDPHPSDMEEKVSTAEMFQMPQKKEGISPGPEGGMGMKKEGEERGGVQARGRRGRQGRFFWPFTAIYDWFNYPYTYYPYDYGYGGVDPYYGNYGYNRPYYGY